MEREERKAWNYTAPYRFEDAVVRRVLASFSTSLFLKTT